LQQAGDKSRENKNSENSPNIRWKKLKEIQKLERQTFFASGKSEFKELRNPFIAKCAMNFVKAGLIIIRGARKAPTPRRWPR